MLAGCAVALSETAGPWQPQSRAAQVSQGEAPESAPTALIDARLTPVPEEFSVTDEASWDGRRTLQGIWIAHPDAPTARRVRIVNAANGYAVDGALFRRDDSGSGPAVLVSSDAAAALGMEPGEPARLEIVAIRRLSEADRAAASGSAAPEETGDGSAEAWQPADDVPDTAATAASTEVPAADAADAASAGAAEAAEATESEPASDATLAVASEADEPKARDTDGDDRQAGLASAAARAPEASEPDAETPDDPDRTVASDTGDRAADAGDQAAATDTADTAATEAASAAALPAVGLAALDLGTDAAETGRSPAPADADAAAEAEPSESAGAALADAPPQPRTARSPAAAPSPAPVAASPELSDPAAAPAEAEETAAAPPVEDWPIERDTAAEATREAARAASAPAGKSAAERPAAEQAAEQPTAPETRLARTEPAGTASDAAAEPLDRPFIQAGVFGVESNARRLIRAIEEAGFPAEGRPIGSGERQLTRVVAGPFRTVPERDAALRRIREIGPSDALPVAR